MAASNELKNQRKKKKKQCIIEGGEKKIGVLVKAISALLLKALTD